MNSKIFLIGWLLLANVFLISSMVSAKDLAETKEYDDDKKVDTTDKKATHVDQRFRSPPVGSGSGRRPGGSSGHNPGGGRGSGGYQGFDPGLCYYGCCTYYYGIGCYLCCNYPNEAVDLHTDQLAKP